LALALGLSHWAWPQGKKLTLAAPSGLWRAEITAAPTLSYQVIYQGQTLLGGQPRLHLYQGPVLGQAAKLQKATPRTMQQTVQPRYGTQQTLADHYTELTLRYTENYDVVFRAYNEGLAYRFVTRWPGRLKIKHEETAYALAQDYPGWFSRVRDRNAGNSYEVNHEKMKVSELDSGFTYLPAVLEAGPVKVWLAEADLTDYPGLYLQANGRPQLDAYLPATVTQTKISGWEAGNYEGTAKRFVPYQKLATDRTDFIAETAGTRAFPWRVIGLAAQDKDLLNSHLVYLLASPEDPGSDFNWVRPGKVAWDWWCAVNLTGVDFKTGFNTQTFKYYIDFAARHGIEYVNLDEGWSDQEDLLQVTTQLDMPEVIRYAKAKNVGLFLWCIWHVLDRQMEPALDQFAQWGVAGLKVDFMDRDDQEVVNFYERLAREAAKRKLMINFHGAMKPTGLSRRFPNVVNYEAVLGLEYNKFSTKCTPEHCATIPFTRMLAGPMDFTPGAMQNVNPRDFRVVNDRPMSQGTRCQQLAMYVLYHAPLEMMADAPTAYEREPDLLRFMAQVPTTWHQTLPLAGQLGDFAAIARRRDNQWYLGALTDGTARQLEIALDFLPPGRYQLELFRDGANAHRVGNDYVREVQTVSSGQKLQISLAPGGGWAAKITPLP
jgi:alpha-glucosidase